MSTKRYSLGIVQTHATQFDGPLFNQLSRNSDIDLTVYYTKPWAEKIFDNEIGRRPNWDNDVTTGYRYKIRKAGFLNTVRFMNQIAANHHDLTIISGYIPIFFFAIAVYLRVRGHIVGLRSDTPTWYRTKHSLKEILKDLTMPYMLKLYQSYYHTGTLARQYLLHYRVSENRLFHFPYAVDNNYIAARCNRYKKRRDKIRRALGIDSGAYVVVGVVKFIEREDPITLLKGFARLLKHSPKAHLVLIGDGVLMKDIKDAIDKNKISNVHLPGYVQYSRLPLFYSIADVFVHPATNECWGVSVNEAMVCGLPVVVANTVGSHVDLVKPGETGFVFEGKNPETLAGYLAKLNDDFLLRESMSRNAKVLIAKWDFDCIEKSLLTALATIMKKD